MKKRIADSAITMTASPNSRNRASRRQRGVYAIEFALVFLVFFSVLYAVIGYGTLLTLRFGLQNAAEDGARAGLRYQVVASGTSQIALRRQVARNVALQRTVGWLPVAADVPLPQICAIGASDCTSTTMCNATSGQSCQIVVTVNALGLGSIFPFLGLPDKLVGQASMLLDARAL